MEGKLGCASTCCLVVMGLMFGGIYISTSTLEPIEYGLKFNKISKSYKEKDVYGGGWHLIGPTNTFLTFPATVTNIEFASYKESESPPL